MQVLEIKSIRSVDGVHRYRLIISDGQLSMPSMISTSLNGLVEQGQLTLFSIVRLEEFICTEVHHCKVVIILALTMVESGSSMIGNPCRVQGLDANGRAVPVARPPPVRDLQQAHARDLQPASPASPAVQVPTTRVGPRTLALIASAVRHLRPLLPSLVIRALAVLQEHFLDRGSPAGPLLVVEPLLQSVLQACRLLPKPHPSVQCGLATLSIDELLEVVQRCHTNDHLPLSLVCCAFRDAVGVHLRSDTYQSAASVWRGERHAQLRTTYASVVDRPPSYLRWAVLEANCPRQSLCTAAAAQGRLESVQWLLAAGALWTEACTLAAVRHGRYELLAWAIDSQELVEGSVPHDVVSDAKWSQMRAAVRAAADKHRANIERLLLKMTPPAVAEDGTRSAAQPQGSTEFVQGGAALHAYTPGEAVLNFIIEHTTEINGLPDAGVSRRALPVYVHAHACAHALAAWPVAQASQPYP